MAARSSWLLLVTCLAVASTAAVLKARAQPDSNGFISIDCGLSGKTGYVDNATKLTYSPDAGFTDAGTNHNISSEYISPASSRFFDNVRSFPGEPRRRSCYTLRSLEPGLKYLVRAYFKYGNYDGLFKPPLFELYVGVNFWRTVNITDPGAAFTVEAVVVVPVDSMEVCLVNTGGGTPFISSLELRPLKNSLYPQANATQGLVMLIRVNFGPTDTVVRYPEDPRDRIWVPWIDTMLYTEISTTKTVQNLEKDSFEAPSAVMQTAITPRNASANIDLQFVPDPNDYRPSAAYITVLHFSELQLLEANAVRSFNITINDVVVMRNLKPDYLYADASYDVNPRRGAERYNISLRPTATSTLPPIINALEIFSVISTTNVPTDNKDVSAITAIKKQYQVKENWMGDPCIPKALAWDWLTCSYAMSNPPTITGVNLSLNGLHGDISPSFTNLKSIQYLNLSNNFLTGSIPEDLSQLSSLTVLDLSGNQLSGSIPSGLLKRMRDNSLDLRYANNPNLCNDGNNNCPPSKRKGNLAIFVSVPVVVVTVILMLAFLCLLRRKKKGPANITVNPQNEQTSQIERNDGYSAVIQLENRQFTYKDLQMITNNFQRVLGRGGFGYVYYGILEDNTQVAVKLRSQSSVQGVKEFIGEAQTLTRIHHKNLVSMIGYCKDGEYMALVYEYMSEGTLADHIGGRSHSGKFLSWRERLRIALESAQGLEYLHKGCSPPLIHRDVKATNILLNIKLEAKIADFGLSKAFNRDNDTHVSTTMLVGTPGYVDPEYHATMKPTTKSDVYSFGIVLLELVTGKPPILRAPEPVSITHWVQQRLSHGNIESVVDTCMDGVYDVNSIWKVADIALKCTAQTSAQRPTMTDVVLQLQECLELQQANDNHGISQTNSPMVEIGQLEGMPLPTISSTGPAAR